MGVGAQAFLSYIREAPGLAQGEHGCAVADAVGRHALLAHLLQQPLRLRVAACPPAGRHGVVVANRLGNEQVAGAVALLQSVFC